MIANVAIAIAYALLPVGWAFGVVPTGGLAALLTAPLAMRLGDLRHARPHFARDLAVIGVLALALYIVGAALYP